MLIIEQNRNGQRIVKLKKDWHPGRIGLAYVPGKSYVDSQSMERVQRALLAKRNVLG